MFCDLVGSTALSTRLDPEDLREVIADYHKSVTQVVTGFGGYVAKYMATAFWFISAIRRRARPMPKMRCGRRLP